MYVMKNLSVAALILLSMAHFGHCMSDGGSGGPLPSQQQVSD